MPAFPAHKGHVDWDARTFGEKYTSPVEVAAIIEYGSVQSTPSGPDMHVPKEEDESVETRVDEQLFAVASDTSPTTEVVHAVEAML